jgi:hypothetical protein
VLNHRTQRAHWARGSHQGFRRDRLNLYRVCHGCLMLLVCLLVIVAVLHTPTVEGVDPRSCRPPSDMEGLAAIAQQVRQ